MRNWVDNSKKVVGNKNEGGRETGVGDGGKINEEDFSESESYERQSRSRRDLRLMKNKQEKGKRHQSTKKNHQRGFIEKEKEKLRLKEEMITKVAKRLRGTITQIPSDLVNMAIKGMSKSPFSE